MALQTMIMVFQCLQKGKPELFTLGEVNDLIRDLDLTKELAQILSSCLKEKRLVVPGIKQEKSNFVSTLLNTLALCTIRTWNMYYQNMELYITRVNAGYLQFFPEEPHGSTFTHGNKFASIPVAYSMHLKECYENAFSSNKVFRTQMGCMWIFKNNRKFTRLGSTKSLLPLSME